MAWKAVRRVKTVLLGKNGQVGWELQRALAPLGEVAAFGSDAIDLADIPALRAIVREAAPEVIVNAAAYTAVDKAESEPEQAHRINAEAVGVLAEEARRLGAWLVHYSTDYVFDGSKADAYVESDVTAPLSVYGKTKLEGENALRKSHDRHLIFRTSWVYAARGSNFAKTILRLAKDRESLKVVADQHGAPTSAELLADVTALCLYRIRHDRDAARIVAGTYHVVAAGETTWCDYARYLVAAALRKGAELKCGPEAIEAIPTDSYPTAARRPKNSRLKTDKFTSTFGIQLPDWRFHVTRLVDELGAGGLQ
jgi:dTDP-4-dehydrorhamnose reductase